MCTVTFIARRNGYALGMNRDEKLTRAAGLPPRLTHLNGHAILAPSEPGGGTWIGVNDTGATLALINWYSITARTAGSTVSRGEVVKLALPSDSPAQVDATLKELPLARMNPFRLIGVFPTCKAVVEWRWNLQHLERRDHRWRTNTWISSGFDEPGAQQTRGKAFREAMRQKSAGSPDWLRRLHRSHGPECGPYSTCMHREDAATVSYTEVVVSRQLATMSHAPGALCRTALLTAVAVQLCAIRAMHLTQPASIPCGLAGFSQTMRVHRHHPLRLRAARPLRLRSDRAPPRRLPRLRPCGDCTMPRL